MGNLHAWEKLHEPRLEILPRMHVFAVRIGVRPDFCRAAE